MNVLSPRPRIWKTTHLGLQGLPYPLPLPDGTLSIDDRHVPTILSERSPLEINGIAFRNMPAPEHFPAFITILDAIGNGGRRAFLLLSEPGEGKSFMADFLSEMMIGQPALCYECGDKPLGDLLFLTDLTERPETTVYDLALEALREGALHPLNAAELTDALGSAWDQASNAVHWQQIVEQGPERRAQIQDLFQRIVKTQGIRTENSLSWREKLGVLLQGYAEDRPVLGDEINKAHPETSGPLQRILQWLAREQETYAVTSSSGKRIELGSLENARGYFLIATGNPVTDGVGTFELPKALRDRFLPFVLPRLKFSGLQHRFCQMMTGVPVSTLNNLYGQHMKNSPETFQKLCQDLRVLGLSQEAAERVPQHHTIWLNQPENVLAASRQAAELWLRWEALVDPCANNQPNEILAEVTHAFANEAKPSPRLFLALLRRALEGAQRSQLRTLGFQPGFSLEPLGPQTLEPPSTTRSIGRALMEALEFEIHNRTPNQPNVRNALQRISTEHGFLSPDAAPTPGSLVRPIDALLDIDLGSPQGQNNVAAASQTLQHMLCGWLNMNGFDDLLPSDLAPLLPDLTETLRRLQLEPDRFVTLRDDEALHAADPSGIYMLAATRLPLIGLNEQGVLVLDDDPEAVAFTPNRLLTPWQFLTSLTLANGAQVVWDTLVQESSRVGLPAEPTAHDDAYILELQLPNNDDETTASPHKLNDQNDKTAVLLRLTQENSNKNHPFTYVMLADLTLPEPIQDLLQETVADSQRASVLYFNVDNFEPTVFLDTLQRSDIDLANLLNVLKTKLIPDAQAAFNEQTKKLPPEQALTALFQGVVQDLLEPNTRYIFVKTPTRTQAALAPAPAA